MLLLRLLDMDIALLVVKIRLLTQLIKAVRFGYSTDGIEAIGQCYSTADGAINFVTHVHC